MPKLLVANRGEIAIRILRSAQELGWTTVALYTEGDTSHATYAEVAIKLNDASEFMNVDRVVEIAQRTLCTHLHPGYGFLSESPALARALLSSNVTLVGPSIEVLTIASDKMQSRTFAKSLGIPIARGMTIFSTDDVRTFSQKNNGYPVMIKALDGGGGRGIRIVKNEAEVEDAFKRCLGESPSHQLFIEEALITPGWKHIEVQIVGDGTGAAIHLWDRECSIQRRFQKVVEIAPSTLSRAAVEPLLFSAVEMASKLRYKGLGTFEYLYNIRNKKWVFLEINPRIQVEHTVTEEITGLDLVRLQLLLSLPSTSVGSLLLSPPVPRGHAIQLRLTAEDPTRSFILSPGTIRSLDLTWPAGRGVRVDTWLSTATLDGEQQWIVGSDFDSLLAKIVIHGSSFAEVAQRASRALLETSVRELQTNLVLLAGIVGHRDWTEGATNISTSWLEDQVADILDVGTHALRKTQSSVMSHKNGSSRDTNIGPPRGNILLQPGSVFHLTFSPSNTKHTLKLTSIAHNAFPDHLSGTLQTTLSPHPVTFDFTQSSSGRFSGEFEFANHSDTSHISSPLAGKIVELHPALSHPGGYVQKGEVFAVISVMKMENVVHASWSGHVVRLGKGVEVGALISEGTLIAVVDGEQKSRL